MKTYSSPLRGEVASPESFSEIVDLTTCPIAGITYNVHMWRGQAEIEWPIDSSAYRRLRLTSGVVSEGNLSSYEEGLLARAHFNGFDVVEGRTLSDFDLLARLQHHGAATRLVDTSRNCLVALYFACNSYPDQYGLLAGFHSEHLGGYEGQGESQPYAAVVKDLARYPHPQTWSPPLVSPRVAAQHSQFLYSRVAERGADSIEISSAPNAFLPIAISPKLKRECMRLLLEVFDIRQATLFPDLTGFCDVNSALQPVNTVYRW